jgi:hypothetical protein
VPPIGSAMPITGSPGCASARSTARLAGEPGYGSTLAWIALVVARAAHPSQSGTLADYAAAVRLDAAPRTPPIASGQGRALSRTWSAAGDGDRFGPADRRGLACLMKTVLVGTSEPRRAGWPEHLPVGALRVVRWSRHYDETVTFYRDIIGLQVLETFCDSYGLDGTILGLPGGPVHLEIVRLGDATPPGTWT